MTSTYIMKYKDKNYKVRIDKPKELYLSVYIAHYIFYSGMKDKHPLGQLLCTEGRPCKIDTELLKQVKIISIEELKETIEVESLFKDGLEVSNVDGK